MKLPWLSNLLTGKDNETHDIARHSWLWTTVAAIGGGVWNAIHSGAVDLTQFAQAIAVIVAAHGGAIWAKKDSEPGPKDEPK